jgi:hypothetical protein
VFWGANDPTSDTGKSCIMQSDGNLVIYDDSNPEGWR